jgi:hypothetical protein
VLIETKQYLVLIRFLILVSTLTFLDFVISGDLFLKTFISKTAFLRYVFDKAPSAKWPTNRRKISCFCQNLPFIMFFAIKTSIFQLRPLLRFLCLINSFYRRYVSRMYNRSNISNRSNILTRFDRLNLVRLAGWSQH